MSRLMPGGLSTSDIANISVFISRLRLDKGVDSLFSILESQGAIVLVGGTIRDVVVKRRHPRDIDLIIDTTKVDFDQDLEGFRYKRNSFGGYKVEFESITVDFWGIHSNWAFKEGILPTTPKNISKGCFFNIDSISLNLSSYEWDGLLFDSLLSKELDIVLDDHAVQLNPTKALNVLRAFILKNEFSLEFSHKVQSYISKWWHETECPLDELCKVEKVHYQNSRTNELEEAISTISHISGKFPSNGRWTLPGSQAEKLSSEKSWYL